MADKTDAHRAIKPGVQLDEILCEQEPRVVGNDWCIRWNNIWLQIDEQHAALDLPRKQILVIHKRDGTLLLKHNGHTLGHTPVNQHSRKNNRKKPPRPAIKNNKAWKPPASHPWKRTMPSSTAARST